jgi:hypothetical protein
VPLRRNFSQSNGALAPPLLAPFLGVRLLPFLKSLHIFFVFFFFLVVVAVVVVDISSLFLFSAGLID